MLKQGIVAALAACTVAAGTAAAAPSAVKPLTRSQIVKLIKKEVKRAKAGPRGPQGAAGPTGARGPTGLQGAQGLQGPQGAPGANAKGYFAQDTQKFEFIGVDNRNFKLYEVLSKPLPAGSYAITTTLEARSQSSGNTVIACVLALREGTTDKETASTSEYMPTPDIGPQPSASLSITAAGTISSAGSAVVRCNAAGNQNGDGGVAATLEGRFMTIVPLGDLG